MRSEQYKDMPMTTIPENFIISDSPERRAFIDALMKQEGYSVDHKSSHPYSQALDILGPVLKEKYGIIIDSEDQLNGQMNARTLVAIQTYMDKHLNQFSAEVRSSFNSLIDAQLFATNKSISDNSIPFTVASGRSKPISEMPIPTSQLKEGGNDDKVQQQIWQHMEGPNHFDRLLKEYGFAPGENPIDVLGTTFDAFHNKNNISRRDETANNISYAQKEEALENDLGNFSAPSFAKNSQSKSGGRNT